MYIETHLHADHASGNIDLAVQTEAEIHLREAANATLSGRTLHDGDVLELGVAPASP